jgi:hypothetical protein
MIPIPMTTTAAPDDPASNSDSLARWLLITARSYVGRSDNNKLAPVPLGGRPA